MTINRLTHPSKQFLFSKTSTNSNKADISLVLSYSYVSLFNPSSIKNITLYHRNLTSNNTARSFRSSFRNYKILVKQSYLMAAWFFYYSNNTLRTKKIKGFVTLPCRSVKHTALKAPMAHKTFSQEQFVIKYYFLTFTFSPTNFNISRTKDSNMALTIINQFFKLPNFSATNLFIIYRVRSWFSSGDSNFFNFNKLN